MSRKFAPAVLAFLLAGAGLVGAVPGTAQAATPAEVPAAAAFGEDGVAVLGDIRGGDPFLTGLRQRCTVGVTVVGGFLTAGHCGRVGDLAYAPNGQVMGVFRGSSYPSRNHAWVELYPGWTPRPEIRTGPSTVVPVRGAAESPVGGSVCRYGSATNWRCGTILARNQSVAFPEGTVYGLTRTNVCADPGDSTASFISGDQAQGIAVGGSGSCASGGATYFQPVRVPLAAYGLTLLTS